MVHDHPPHDLDGRLISGEMFELQNRLIDKHLDPGNRLEATSFRIGEQLRFKWRVDDIKDNLPGPEQLRRDQGSIYIRMLP